jgi:hypothetical protein
MITDGLCCDRKLLTFRMRRTEGRADLVFLMCPLCLREYEMDGTQRASAWWRKRGNEFVKVEVPQWRRRG